MLILERIFQNDKYTIGKLYDGDNYYKFDAGYFNDTNENFVVFFVA